MDTIKIDNKVHFIRNDNFQTIIVTAYFPYYKEKDKLALDSIFPRMLNFMNSKYPTEEEYNIEKLKRYILDISVRNISIGLNYFLVFSMIIPDTYNLNDNYLDKQFEFFRDTIYNPKVIDNGFDKDEVDREIKNTKIGLDGISKNFKSYNSYMIDKLIDDDGILTMDLAYNKELLDDVNPNNLYLEYKRIINNTPIVFATGNIEEEIITNLCNKYLINKNDKFITFNKKYFNCLGKIKDKYNYVEEDSNFKDSALNFIFKIKDYSSNDYKYLYIINSLLCSLSSRLLDKKLRDEFELVYTSSAYAYKYYGLLKISTYINKEKKDLVFDKVMEVINELKDANITTPLIKNIINNERLNLIRDLDRVGSKLGDYTDKTLGIRNTWKEFYDELKNITSRDISLFVDRLVLDTVYFLKEEDNDRDN